MYGIDKRGEIVNRILILANKFDLRCGLKSKFSDFYEERQYVSHNFCFNIP